MSPPAMSPTDVLLPGVLAPAVLCGLVLALGWRPWRADRTIDGVVRPDGRALGGLAVGAAFFAAYGLMSGWPRLPWGSDRVAALEGLAWIALLLGPALLLERPLGRLAPLVRVPCAAGAVWWLLVAYGRSSDRTLFAGLLGGLIVLGAGLQLLAPRARGPALPLALMAVGTASAVTLVVRHVSAALGQLEGALCAALGAAWVLSLWRRRVTLAGPALTAWVILHGALLLAATVYELAPLDAALLAFAPLAAWLAELPAVRRRPGWQVGCLRVGFVLVAAAAPVVRAVLAYEPDPYAY